MRSIKFRARRKLNGDWVYGCPILNGDNDDWDYILPIHANNSEPDYWQSGGVVRVISNTVGEFTGHQLNGVDLYEGDVIRVEEDAPDVDEEDKMNWYVVVFVEEWCMFAMLHTKNEYFQYLKDGKAELDEFLFWTFPIVNSKDSPEKYFLCGNIHQNPELLQK